MPARSRTASMLLKPARRKRASTAKRLPCPDFHHHCAVGIQPRSAFCGDAAVEVERHRYPRRARDAVRGGESRVASVSRSASATYGGFETIRSKREWPPGKRSAATNSMRSSHRWRIALRRATSSASLDMSVATIRAAGAFTATAIAIAPEPVPISRMRGSRRVARNFSAASTNVSVSGRGMRTAGVTSKSSEKNSLCPMM